MLAKEIASERLEVSL